MIRLIARGPRQYDKVFGLLAIEDDHLLAVEDVAVTGLCCGRLAVMQRKAALALYVGKCAQHLTANDTRQPLSLLRLIARALDQTTEQDNGRKIRLDHQPLAQLFHDHRQVDNIATETTVLFSKGDGQPTQLGKELPVIAIHALIGCDDGLAGIPVVVVLYETRD